MHKSATLIGIDLEREAITAAAERLTEKSRRLNGPRPPTNITLIHADVFDSDDKVWVWLPQSRTPPSFDNAFRAKTLYSPAAQCTGGTTGTSLIIFHVCLFRFHGIASTRC